MHYENQTYKLVMKYNSVHRFADLDDARLFVQALIGVGFVYVECEKDGGVIYSNGNHKLLIYVQK